MIIMNQDQVRLCKKGSCCPIVSREDDGQFTITDDYNGKVRITKEELSMLKDAIEHFDDKI